MEVCRLCLDLQSDNNYSPLDGTYKDMVQVVAPELNLEISNAPIVCNECSSNLDELFIFKTRCFEHEEKLRPKCENIKNKFRLKEVLDGTTGGDGTALKTETTKDRICRACLGPIECESFTILKPSEPDAYLDSMLTMCLPELDLELTKDPVMCEACLENLQKLHHFKSTCLDIEDKLASYCESHGTNSSDQINLNSVLESELKMDEDDSDYSNIKSEQFDDESKDTSMKSENDSEMMGDAELKHEEVDIKSETDASAAGSSSDKEPTERKLKCPACSYLANSRSNIRHHMFVRHQITEGDSEIYACQRCDYKTVVSSMLQNHIKNVHGPKNYRCKNCPYASCQKESLKRHVLLLHSDSNQYLKCYQCDFKSLYKSSLKFHIKNIHGQKDYRCEHCTYASRRKWILKRHIQNIHGIGLNILKCKQCKYETKYNLRLKQHLLSHEPDGPFFKCDLCPFQTVYKYAISRHATIHKKGDQATWYPCDQCDFKTKHSHSLSRHKKAVHEERRKYNCEKCSFSCDVKKRFSRHLERKHNIMK